MAISDTKVVQSGFEAKVLKELRSRLHSRFIQYDVFTFSGYHVSASIHITGNSLAITIPFIIYQKAIDDPAEDGYVVLFRNTEMEGSIQGVISFMMTCVRREQSKLAKFKNQN